MTNIRKWQFRFIIIVMVAGGFLGWMALQQTSTAGAAQKGQKVNPGLQMLRASEKGPPEMEKLKDEKPAPTKAPTQSSRDALLQEVLKQPGGKEKVQKAKAKQQGKMVLRASSKEPPETEKLKDEKPAPTKVPTQSSRDSLLQQVLKQPGGKEKIQKANPKGFKLGVKSDTTGWFLPSLSYLNPFKAGIAHAGEHMWLSPKYNYKTSPFYGWLATIGELGGYSNNFSYGARLVNYTLSSQIGTSVVKPSAQLKIYAPTSGWYLLNFGTGYYGAKATLKHYNGSGYETAQTWDSRSRRSTGSSYVDHPALLNLERGYHIFFWIVEPGSRSDLYFYGVSIERM